MASLVVAGDSSGSVTLAAPAVAGTTTLTLPTTSGTLVVTGGAQTVQFAAGSAAAPSITFTGDTNTGIFSPAADTIAFTEGGVEAMRIDSSGNVGIGTNSPIQKLDVRGAIAATDGGTQTTYISNAGEIELARTAGDAYIDFKTSTAEDYDCRIQQASDGLRFLTGGNGSSSERMRITSGGNIGIGTSSPNERLMVAGAIRSTSNATDFSASDGALIDYNAGDMRIVAARSGANSSNMTFTTYSSGSAGERMRITSGGKILCGTTDTGLSGDFAIAQATSASACASLWNSATSGNNLLIQFYTDGGFGRGSIDYNRGANQIRYNTTSDQRLKENIVDSSSALPLINSVKIRAFDWKETGFHVEHGVIAQELETVSPDAVSVGEDNEDGTMKRPWGVDTAVLVPALIKAIQEQQQIINDLKARIETLENT
jgi:hypothetical protein